MSIDTEWHVPDPGADVRQGDCLVRRDPVKGTIEEMCLVITADCDISKGKFGRELVCLRIVSFADYLRTVWASRKLRRAVENETEKVRTQLARWHSLQLGVESRLSAEAVSDWVKKTDPRDICAQLMIPAEDAIKVATTLTTFRRALLIVQQESQDAFKKLVAFRCALQRKDRGTEIKEALKQAQNETLPDDVFLLTSLPQADVGPIVVLLREVSGVPHDRICYRTVDAPTKETFLRVGRLLPPFKYAVSQAFGFLYSRIGLPDWHDSKCRVATNRIDVHDLG